MTDRHAAPFRNTVDKGDVVPWQNNSGETIPPFAVIQLRTDRSSGLSYASKPIAGEGLFYVNGPVEVPPGRRGESLLWNRPRRVRVVGAAAVGDTIGPVAGQWHMAIGGFGYYVIHQAVEGIATVVQGSTGGVRMSWGTLGQNSGRHDMLLPVQLKQSASLEEFTADGGNLAACPGAGSGSGSGSGLGSGQSCDDAFLDMTMSWCGAGAGSGSGSGSQSDEVIALVPAGYKAGPVVLVKMPVCAAAPGPGSGSGSGDLRDDWQGWVVLAGRRMRATAKVPTEIACCPGNTLKFTAWDRFWYFGGPCSPCLDPCETSGSGSGSGSGGGGGGTGCFQTPTCCDGILWPNDCCGSDGSTSIGFCDPAEPI